MTGNLITNQILTELVEANLIEFKPYFDLNKVQIAQYPLTAKSFLKKTDDKSFQLLHDFTKNDSFKIRPNQYIIVEVLEQIILPRGIVGRFIPASNLIELGLGLTAGKLEFPFGNKGERIRFGLKNHMEEEILFEKDFRIAYIEFFDLRGLKQSETKLTERDLKIYSRRFPIDNDGEINHE